MLENIKKILKGQQPSAEEVTVDKKEFAKQAGVRHIKDIVAKPLNGLRIDFSAKFLTADCKDKITEEYIRELHRKLEPMFAKDDESKQIFAAHQENFAHFLKTGDIKSPLNLKDETSQFFWGTALALYAVHPEIGKTWEKGAHTKKITQSTIWRRIASSSYMRNELKKHAELLGNSLNNPDTKIVWSAHGYPNISYCFIPEKNLIIDDMLWTLIAGTSAAVPAMNHEIAHAIGSQHSETPRMQEIEARQKELMKTMREAAKIKDRETYNKAAKEATRLKLEFQYRFFFLDELENMYANRFVVNLGGQYDAAHLNELEADINVGKKYLTPQTLEEAKKKFSQSPKERVLHIKALARNSFFANNELIEQHKFEDWHTLHLYPELLSGIDASGAKMNAEESFETIREICNKFETTQPSQRLRNLNEKIYQKRLSVMSERRSAMVDEFFDMFVAPHMEELYQKAEEQYNKQEKQLQNQMQNKQQNSQSQQGKEQSEQQSEQQNEEQSEEQNSQSQGTGGDQRENQSQGSNQEQEQELESNSQSQENQAKEENRSQGKDENKEENEGNEHGENKENEQSSSNSEQQQDGAGKEGNEEQAPQTGDENKEEREGSEHGENKEEQSSSQGDNRQSQEQSDQSQNEGENDNDENAASNTMEGFPPMEQFELPETNGQHRPNLSDEEIKDLLDKAESLQDLKKMLEEHLSDEEKQQLKEIMERRTSQNHGDDKKTQDNDNNSDIIPYNETPSLIDIDQMKKLTEDNMRAARFYREGNWDAYQKYIAQYQNEIAAAKRIIGEIIKQNKLDSIHRGREKIKEKMTKLPVQGGRTIDLQRHVALEQKLRRGDPSITRKDLERFRTRYKYSEDEIIKDIEIPQSNFGILIDGSGSMTGKPFENALAISCILFEAARSFKEINVYIYMMGEPYPLTVARPEDTTREIAERLESVRRGQGGCMDFLTPAIRQLLVDVSEDMLEHPHVKSGFTHIFSVTDGGNGDYGSTDVNGCIEKLLTKNEQITFDSFFIDGGWRNYTKPLIDKMKSRGSTQIDYVDHIDNPKRIPAAITEMLKKRLKHSQVTSVQTNGAKQKLITETLKSIRWR